MMMSDREYSSQLFWWNVSNPWDLFLVADCFMTFPDTASLKGLHYPPTKNVMPAVETNLGFMTSALRPAFSQVMTHTLGTTGSANSAPRRYSRITCDIIPFQFLEQTKIDYNRFLEIQAQCSLQVDKMPFDGEELNTLCTCESVNTGHGMGAKQLQHFPRANSCLGKKKKEKGEIERERENTVTAILPQEKR